MEYGSKIQAVQDEIKDHVRNVEKSNETRICIEFRI